MPEKIEASAFAFFTGTTQITYGFISPMLAVFINNVFLKNPVSNNNIE